MSPATWPSGGGVPNQGEKTAWVNPPVPSVTGGGRSEGGTGGAAAGSVGLAGDCAVPPLLLVGTQAVAGLPHRKRIDSTYWAVL